MVAVATLQADTSPWLIRPYDANNDEDALMYMVGVGYTRSRAGQRAGASHAGGSTTLAERTSPLSPEEKAARRHREAAFIETHRFIWLWLLENATVSLAVDPAAPHIIWAWLLTTGDVIHAVGCKRSLIEAGVSVEVVRDLLGNRLTRHQVCSLELPQMRTRGSDAVGIDRPQSWSMDPTWLLTRVAR